MTDDASGADGRAAASADADERPLGPAELADIARRQLGRGIPNDRPFLFLDLRDDGLRIVTIDPIDGIALDDHLVTTIRPSVLDHQLSDHLVRTGRVDQPTTDAWAKELLDLAGRGRARLATLDGTFIMGRDHVKFFRVARRDLDVATASTAAIAVQYALEASAAAPETVSSIILGPRHQIWPGFASVLTQTAGLPVIAIEPVNSAQGMVRAPVADPAVAQRSAEPAVRASVVRSGAAANGPAITRAAAVSPAVTRSAGAAQGPTQEQPSAPDAMPPAATAVRSSRNGPETVETDFVSRMARSLRTAPIVDEPADADVADEDGDTLIDEDSAEDVWADDSWNGSTTTRIPTGGSARNAETSTDAEDRPDADVIKTEVVRTDVVKADVVHTEVLNASVINAGYINTDPTLYKGSASASRSVPERTSPPKTSAAPEAFVPAPLSSFGSAQAASTWGRGGAAGRSNGAIVKRQPHLEWKKWRPGRRGLIALAALAVIAAIVTGVVLAVGGGEEQATSAPASAAANPNTATAPSAAPKPEYADPIENAEARKPALRYTPPPPPPVQTQEQQSGSSSSGSNRRAPRPRAKPRVRTIPNPIPGLPPIRLP